MRTSMDMHRASAHRRSAWDLRYVRVNNLIYTPEADVDKSAPMMVHICYDEGPMLITNLMTDYSDCGQPDVTTLMTDYSDCDEPDETCCWYPECPMCEGCQRRQDLEEAAKKAQRDLEDLCPTDGYGGMHFCA